jgi:hypothetical protein
VSNSTFKYEIVKDDQGNKNITVIVFGDPEPYEAHSSHPAWDAILKGVLADDPNVLALFDVGNATAQQLALSERISYVDGRPNGKLFFDGDEQVGGLANHITRMVAAGEDVQPFLRLMENIYQNPSENSRKQFLEGYVNTHNITITDDGYLVLFKYVYRDRDGYRSGHVGPNVFVNGVAQPANKPVHQNIGDVVTMPRSKVVDDPRTACSHGLHCGSWNYVSGSGDVRLEIHVHPRDVVSVPHHDPKLRVCRYRIVGERSADYDVPVLPATLKPAFAFPQPVPQEAVEEAQNSAPEPSAPSGEVKHPSTTEFKALQAKSLTRRRPIRTLVKESKKLNWTLLDGCDGTRRTHWAV